MNPRSYFSLTLCVFAVHAYGGSLTANDFKRFNPISQGLRRASNLTLFEGLPHQTFEAKQLKEELATKRTIRLRGYPFYERPLAVTPDVIERLRGLSAAPSSYETYGGPKLCGEFHPDYCLTWKHGDALYDLLICLGCFEMKLYGPTSELILDIPHDKYKAFKSALKSQQAQRPKPQMPAALKTNRSR